MSVKEGKMMGIVGNLDPKEVAVMKMMKKSQYMRKRGRGEANTVPRIVAVRSEDENEAIESQRIHSNKG